jgi:hypothetical protein
VRAKATTSIPADLITPAGVYTPCTSDCGLPEHVRGEYLFVATRTLRDSEMPGFFKPVLFVIAGAIDVVTFLPGLVAEALSS